MFTQLVLLAATAIGSPEVPAEPAEAPSIRETVESERVFSEAHAILEERRRHAKDVIARTLEANRGKGSRVEVPAGHPDAVPNGEITVVNEDGAVFLEDAQVDCSMKAKVAITESTVRRFQIESWIMTRHADTGKDHSGSGSMSIATRVRQTKVQVGGGSRFKAGNYERFYVLGARCLKTGDAVVLDAARVTFTVVPRNERDK